MTTDEIWLPIPEWEGWYSVSNFGRIRSENRTIACRDGRPLTVRQLIMRPGGNGSVLLSRNAKSFKVSPRRLAQKLFGEMERVRQ